MKQPVKVLLIEENSDDARLLKGELRAVLSGSHIQIEWAEKLEQGLEQLRSNRELQAVLLDLSAVGHADFNILQRVLDCAPREVPVIVMTGLADEEMGMQAVRTGAQDYLIKGELDGRLLARSIQYAIQRKQIELQLADVREFAERIVTSSPVGIFTYKLSGECLSVNTAAAEMVGGTVEQLKSQNFHQLESWKRSGLYEMARQTINTGKATKGDFHVLTTFRRDAWYAAQFVLFHLGGEDLLLMMFHDITEHKQAEAAVDAMQKRFQALIENAPDGIALLGLDGKLRQVTPSTQQILGYTGEEAEGQDPALLTHPDDLPALLGLLNDVIQNPEKVVNIQYRFLHKNGSWRWLDSTITNLIAEPSVQSIVFNYRDITGRREIEEALRDSEERFRTLVSSMNDIIFTLDREQRHTGVFGSSMERAGLTPEAFLGKTVREILGEEAALVHEDANRRALAGETVTYEWSVAGTQRLQHTQTSLSPLRDSTGAITGVVGVGRDITDHKQAEEALQEKERLLSEAQRIGHVGSWGYNIRNDVLTLSEEMYRLLDVLPEDFQHNSRDFLALVYPSDRPMAAQWMADIQQGTQAKDLNFRIFHKNGELRYLHCTGVVEFDADAKPVRFIGTTQDVTEHRAAEIQIDQQIKRLMALSEIDRAIISSFDQRYTLGVILSQMISQLHVDAADVLIVDGAGEMLDYVSGQGFRTKLRETAHLGLGESHAGRAAKERRMIRIADLRETTSDLAFSQLVIAEGFVSYIAAPLVVKGKVKGVLEVFQRSLLQPYQDWIEFFNTLAGQTAIAVESTSLFANLQSSNRELTQAYEATIEGWSRAMDLRDREPEGHTQRVTSLTLELARSMGIEESRLTHIRRGALLHDIGKLGVPDHILFKPGELTVEERQSIEQHVDFAYQMLAPIPYLKPALNIPYFHHERWDGTGYPLGLKGEQIPLEARIFSLVDVWDALRSDRPHRKAWTGEQALEYIRAQAGTQFDPRVVEFFLKVIERM